MAQIDFSGSHFSAFPASVYCVYTLDNGVSVPRWQKRRSQRHLATLMGYKSECLLIERFSTLTTERLSPPMSHLQNEISNFCQFLLCIILIYLLVFVFAILAIWHWIGIWIGLMILASGLVLLLKIFQFPKSNEEFLRIPSLFKMV